MACSRPTPSDDGYATTAAVVVSLSLAIIATAVSDRSLAALELARADLDRTRAELALDGAQEAAALQIAETPEVRPLRWSASFATGKVMFLAEPEAAKLGLAAVADLEDTDLRRLGASNAQLLKARLKVLAQTADDADDLALADPSPVWRRCSRSWISPEGLATTLQGPIVPKLAAIGPGAGRTGEVWRLRASFEGGWIDDRTVRFTGDPNRPARIIRRRFFKSSPGSGPCELASAH